MVADLVPVPGVLLGRLDAIGVDVAEVLRRAGLTRSRLEVPSPRVTTHEFMAFWRAIEDVAPSRDLGLRLGAEALPHRYDVASLTALHSKNLGEALSKVARYKRLVCPEEVTTEITRGEVRVRFHWLLAEGALPLFLVDSTFASVLAFARQGTGQPVAPKRIELARKPRDAALLTAHFGCKITFDAVDDRLVLDEKWLDVPFVTHNADLVAMLVPALEAALVKEPRRSDFATEARAALSRRMRGERPSVETLASDLGLSQRTLQRRLEDAGTSYQTLLDDVRRRSARQLLAATRLDIGEIAFLLGFEELNSFSRSFRRWEGTTPARFRAAAT